jgi:hypothetical protein
MKRRTATVAGSVLAILSFCLAAAGDESDALTNWPTAEMHFSRMYYRDAGYGRGFGGGFSDCGRGGSWLTDCPEAEVHFTMGVRRLTRVDIGDSRMLRLTDDSIFNYPWLYAVMRGVTYGQDDYATGAGSTPMTERLMVANDFNMDLGDAWEHAGTPLAMTASAAKTTSFTPGRTDGKIGTCWIFNDAPEPAGGRRK